MIPLKSVTLNDSLDVVIELSLVLFDRHDIVIAPLHNERQCFFARAAHPESRPRQ